MLHKSCSLKPEQSPERRAQVCNAPLKRVTPRASLSGDHSAVEPPVPIPNTEVKRCSPDDSASIGRAKVGRRQYLPPLASSPLARGGFFFRLSLLKRAGCSGGARGGSFSRPRNFITRMRAGVLWSRRVRTRSSLSVRGCRPCSGVHVV